MTKGIYLILALIASFALIAGVASATVNGVNWTTETTTKTPTDEPMDHLAYAGNVSFLDMVGSSATQSWQGYYGNVSGVIELTDGSNNVMYNWSVASPTGEVYASVNGSTTISWATVDCFDLAGNTTALETMYNISTDDVDGVNETFSDSNNHVVFYTGSKGFTANQCAAAYIFDGAKQSTAGQFVEVLLTDKTSDAQAIFTALLEDNTAGFDGEDYDFEMLVLENGHGTAAATGTPYYFYVELDA